jgi:hypothetical protein
MGVSGVPETTVFEELAKSHIPRRRLHRHWREL